MAAFLKLCPTTLIFAPIVFPSSQFASLSYRGKAMLTVSSLNYEGSRTSYGQPRQAADLLRRSPVEVKVAVNGKEGS